MDSLSLLITIGTLAGLALVARGDHRILGAWLRLGSCGLSLTGGWWHLSFQVHPRGGGVFQVVVGLPLEWPSLTRGAGFRLGGGPVSVSWTKGK
ncbi:MAG TPA: hypothetical protein VEI97_14770 [bacterium]|nr:hypothetical protein [bacterium]